MNRHTAIDQLARLARLLEYPQGEQGLPAVAANAAAPVGSPDFPPPHVGGYDRPHDSSPVRPVTNAQTNSPHGRDARATWHGRPAHAGATPHSICSRQH